MLVFTEHNRADRISFEIQRKAKRILREFEHLALHDIGEPMNTTDAVGNRNNGALRARFGRRTQVLNPASDEFADF
jgi:hypothetical protein